MRKNTKTQLVSTDNTISKSNELSLSKMNTSLSLQQIQLFFFAIYLTQKGTTSFRKSEFEKYFSIARYNTVSAKEDVAKLMDLKIATEDLSNDYFEYWNVFSRIAYRNGLFEFSWTPPMIPHILELKEKFILTDLGVISKFSCNYSWRLYEFLKAKHGFWNLRLSREELSNLFSVENLQAYKKNGSAFKRRVLNPAIAEINAYTEYTVEYKEVKNGRKTVAFDLSWSKGKTVKLISEKQKVELSKYVATIIDDMVNVFTLSSEKQQEALRILNSTHKYKIEIEKGLSQKQYTQVAQELRNLMEQYSALFED